jgi:hypothetical protein
VAEGLDAVHLVSDICCHFQQVLPGFLGRVHTLTSVTSEGLRSQIFHGEGLELLPSFVFHLAIQIVDPSDRTVHGHYAFKVRSFAFGVYCDDLAFGSS